MNLPPPVQPLPLAAVCAARPSAPLAGDVPAPDPDLVAAAVDRVLLLGLEEAIAATRTTPARTLTLEDLYAVVAMVEAAAAAVWPLEPITEPLLKYRPPSSTFDRLGVWYGMSTPRPMTYVTSVF